MCLTGLFLLSQKFHKILFNILDISVTFEICISMHRKPLVYLFIFVLFKKKFGCGDTFVAGFLKTLIFARKGKGRIPAEGLDLICPAGRKFAWADVVSHG